MCLSEVRKNPSCQRRGSSSRPTFDPDTDKCRTRTCAEHAIAMERDDAVSISATRAAFGFEQETFPEVQPSPRPKERGQRQWASDRVRGNHQTHGPLTQVSLSIPSEIDIGQDERAVSFTVRKDGALVGMVFISEGAISWRPAYSRRRPMRRTWKKFGEWMTD